VALVVDPEGVVSAFGLAEASSDERPIADALLAGDRHGAYLADKGFIPNPVIYCTYAKETRVVASCEH
jgi:hypothetical protein